MKYEITYSCGHEDMIELFGPTKTREWILKKEAEKICPNCQAEERTRLSAQAAERAAKMDLPKLQGSPKQIQWAETLRMEFVNGIDDIIKSRENDAKSYDRMLKDPEKRDWAIERLKWNVARWDGAFGDVFATQPGPTAQVIQMILAETAASYWIEGREHTPLSRLDSYMENNRADIIRRIKDAAGPKPEEPELIKPEKATRSGVAEVIVDEERQLVFAKYEKDDEFRAIMKDHYFDWSSREGTWVRRMSAHSGDASDRAAELALILLKKGFVVKLGGAVARAKVLSPDTIVPEQRAWVKRVDNLTVGLYFDRDDTLYQRARSLPGAKWGSFLRCMTMPASRFAEIRDFARLYGFSIDPKAEALLQAQEASLNAALVVNAKPPQQQKGKDGLADMLKRDNKIIEDLKD